MSETYPVLRHKSPWGETSLELVIRRTSCRTGVVQCAGPERFRFLEGLTVRTRAGWYQAVQEQWDGSTWLSPWLVLVRVGRGEYVLLLEHVKNSVSVGCSS